MCLLAPESNTHRGVVVGLEGMPEMVLMEMSSSDARSDRSQDRRIERDRGIMGSDDHWVIHLIIIGFED